LALSGNTLYGTTVFGGSLGYGTVFAVNTDGTGFTNLHNFSTINDRRPSALISSGSSFYGMTEGNPGDVPSYGGTVFKLSPSASPPQLTITPAGANVILSWQTNATGFALQSTTALGSAAAWTIVSPDPIVANGQNLVTNSISGTQQFFRLAQ
jgi:uncharacterized repeat protein (TIGR03803 family)